MERRAITVEGIVQGVGFRPFVYALAMRHALGGFVRNRAGSIEIEVEGDPVALDRFLADLAAEPPPLARVQAIAWKRTTPLDERDFRIDASETEPSQTVFVSPDAATCVDCLRELFDPADRRYRYPFLNCTNCGPRLTIIHGAPYDRARTTMAGFPLCAACRAEYDDPADRRFHAQPIACPACGPQLSLLDSEGTALPVGDPLAEFATAIMVGRIGAMKGLGGFHLVCDAGNEMAVAALRARKHRDEKPFAIMVSDLAAAAALCDVGPQEAALLGSPQAPIVLLRKRSADVLPGVAPGNPCLGVMLPYAPLHHLLLREVDSRPLVATSANRADEPIAYRDDAAKNLAGIAGVFLTHNRPIRVRCDDSVVRVVDGLNLPVRRSRGYAPEPISLPMDCPKPILAVGGQLKATFALARGRQAILSHHLGDLDHLEASRAFEEDLELYQQLFEIRPAVVVHDLHPDYTSTRFALRLADRTGTAVLAVQHHHAHMAACMAEHGLMGEAIGVTFDGTGYGPDGTVWGGEFLTGGYRYFRRAARLRAVPMPGGDRAIQEPWRMAVAHLVDAGCEAAIARLKVSPSGVRVVRIMLERGLNCPLTSSVGRLFDAVAAIAGLRQRAAYEGQAAIELEAAAATIPEAGRYPFEMAWGNDGIGVLDTRPLIRGVAEDAEAGTSAGIIARRFHSTLVELIAATCYRIRNESGLNRVVLSGGVFLNALLTHETCVRLQCEEFEVYRHTLVPPSDGGLALGQAAIAAMAG